MEPLSLVAGISALIAAIQGLQKGSSEIIGLIWSRFFANIDIPPSAMNCVRGRLFTDPVQAVQVLLHIWEDYQRDADRGDATAWEIDAACTSCGMSIMQANKVRMMWYYLWGNVAAAQATDYYNFVHDNLLQQALANLSSSEKDAVIQFCSLNAQARAAYLAQNPPSSWSATFLTAMQQAAAVFGLQVPFSGLTSTGGNGAGTSSGSSALPLTVLAAAVGYFALRRSKS